MSDLLFLIPLLPVVAATVNFIFGRWWLRSLAGPIAVAAVAGSWILSLLAFIDQIGSDEPLKQHLYTWIPAGDLSIPMNLQIDHLTAVMLMLVTTVIARLLFILVYGQITYGWVGFEDIPFLGSMPGT